MTRFVTREAVVDKEYGKFRIPAGTAIMAATEYIHRDPRHWDHPDEFDAERCVFHNFYGEAVHVNRFRNNSLPLRSPCGGRCGSPWQPVPLLISEKENSVQQYARNKH